MACDPTDGNGSSFYTIDLTDASTSLVGTNSEEDGVVGIAFDDDGQMYAIYLVRNFFMIDKTDGTATFVGEFKAAVSGLTHHGLDFDPTTQTMYMVSYNVFTFDNELWTIDLATGANTLVGSVGNWTGSLAVEPEVELMASFSADVTELCEGEMVAFSDESIGSPEAWLWTFEGGAPATSTAQNPVVTYPAAGLFDVTLEVTAGTSGNTMMAVDFITVIDLPAPENSDCFTTTEPFEVVIEECTSVNEFPDHGIAISPNPAYETLVIQVTGLEDGELLIYDGTGRIVQRKTYSKMTREGVSMDIRTLDAGLYFIRVAGNGSVTFTTKFMKSN